MQQSANSLDRRKDISSIWSRMGKTLGPEKAKYVQGNAGFIIMTPWVGEARRRGGEERWPNEEATYMML